MTIHGVSYNAEWVKSLSFTGFYNWAKGQGQSKEDAMEIYTAITGVEAKEDEEPAKETKPTKK